MNVKQTFGQMQWGSSYKNTKAKHKATHDLGVRDMSSKSSLSTPGAFVGEYRRVEPTGGIQAEHHSVGGPLYSHYE